MADIERLIELVILDAWRSDHPDHRDCPSLRVVNAQAGDATFEMGVDLAWFTATIGCEHREPADYVFNEFGMVAGFLEDVVSDYADQMEGQDS